MARHVLRRLLLVIGILLLSLMAIYALLHLAPGGMLSQLRLISDPHARFSDRDIENTQRILALDKPVPLRFAAWLTGDDWMGVLKPEWQGDGRGIIRGDFGTSWTKHRPVSIMLRDRLANTFLDLSLALALGLLLAVPIGLAASAWRGRTADAAFSAFASLGTSVLPSWAGLLAIIVLNHQFMERGLPYLPSGGSHALRPPEPGSLLHLLGAQPGSLLDRTVHLAIPVVIVAVPLAVAWSHFLRGRTRELRRGPDLGSHAKAADVDGDRTPQSGLLRAALVPLLAIAIYQLPVLFGYEVVQDTVFAYPSTGRLLVEALYGQDWPVLQAYLVIAALLVVLAILVSDLLHAFGDRRAAVRRQAAVGNAMELAWDFSRPDLSYSPPQWREVWPRFVRMRLARFSLVLVSVIIMAVLIGPLVTPYDADSIPEEHYVSCRNLGPLSTCDDGFHILGTDRSARDYATRLAVGGRTSLLVAVIAAALGALLGTLVGIISGTLGSLPDRAIGGLTDYLIAFPLLPALLIAYTIVPMNVVGGGSITLVAIVLVLFGWMPAARMVRDRVVALKGGDASRGSVVRGLADWRKMIPAVAEPLLLTTIIGVSAMLMLEGTLSFLGFGIQPPDASWGNMLQDVQGRMFDDPLEVFYPILAVTTTCFAFHLLGTSLRRAVRPNRTAGIAGRP